MKMLFLNESDIESLVDMRATVSCLENAFREQSLQRVLLPDRQIFQEKGSAAIVRVMAASATTIKALGLKVLLGSPKTRRSDASYFVTLLFDPGDAALLAVLSSKRLTQLRTGGASAIATKCLAKQDASTIGLIGAGVQGLGQLEGIASVISLKGGFVFDVIQDNARKLIENARTRFGLSLTRASGLEEVYDADVLCTATTSTTPILFGEKLKSGSHINAVGSNAPDRQEIDESVLGKSRIFVDRKEQVLKESGDFMIPIKAGHYSPEKIEGEVCDVLAGKIKGRKSRSEITLFKSVGIALEDIAVARLAYDLALKKGVGQEFSA